jgi:fructokinase
MIRLGIDLGGTKTEVAALDQDGRLLLRHRTETPTAYDAKLNTINEMVLAMEAELGLTGLPVGVGHPGSLSVRTGLIRNANSSDLNGRALDRDLSTLLNRPVRCANDANCFALSEATDGAGAFAQSVFGVILGTGVGGGLVLKGRVHAGHDGNAGEWGHAALPWPGPDEVPGPACKCGLSGCIEAWCSGPGLSSDHERVTGETLSAEEISGLAAEGDAAARATLERHAGRVARGLALVVNIADPECIVLGGGLSNLSGLAERLQQRLAAFAFTDALATRIVRHRHGDSSGVRGAAWLNPLPSR